MPDTPRAERAVERAYAKQRARVERWLNAALPGARAEGAVVAAMREAVLGGGKRVRPILALRVAEMLGARPERVRGLCVAVELLHTASFILDDLPSMDGAYERRGKPPLHLQFDEATAILAANALLVLAFEELVRDVADAPTSVRLRLVEEASRTVGHAGMAGGQHEDLTRFSSARPGRRFFEHVQRQKTGTLFEFAARGAALLSGARSTQVQAVGRFAVNVGIAFQMTDDLLAATKSPKFLGKGSRHDTGKEVLRTPLDVAWARRTVDRLMDDAVAAMAPFGERCRPLCEVARLVRARAHR